MDNNTNNSLKNCLYLLMIVYCKLITFKLLTFLDLMLFRINNFLLKLCLVSTFLYLVSFKMVKNKNKTILLVIRQKDLYVKMILSGGEYVN